MRPGSSVAAAALMIAMASVSAPAVAQTPPNGDWSVVDRQPATTMLVFSLRGGEDVVGRLLRATGEDVTVATQNGEERAIPKSLVRKVTTADRHKDGVVDGGVRGAALGALAMLGFVAASYAACGEGCEAPAVGPVIALAAGVGIGGGFGLGALIDRANDARLVLYRERQDE